MRKFFIVGCPRSGTTMVQQALNRHSQIVIPPETKFFFSFLGHCQPCQARHVDRINKDLKISLPTPARPVRSVADGRAFYEGMARQYIERLGRKDVAYFGEKTPEHTGHLSRIRRLFPDAKVVVLCRDGRDVASSLTRMPWMSPDLYVNFAVWLYYYRLIRAAQKEGGPHLYVARYEDIVANPARELAAILSFLDLPYEPDVAEGHGNREGIPEREYAWKERALEKINTSRVGIFRRELTNAQIESLERLGGHALSSLGYDLVSDGKRSLSLDFVLRLGCNISRLVARLPWHSVVNELLGRSFFCGSSAHVAHGSAATKDSSRARLQAAVA
jgi:hypothetical protein